MNYQKVYMNQIHSSSLLCQLAQMWRSQLVCDAYIRTGPITTKAHRVVLLAACPMLQSMEKASTGSHLEVRLTADIKQEAVNMFLQYLYEGFMLLTEDNVKDVEKVARLLQVDSVIKCCADFFKCLESKTGSNMYSSSKYKYTSYDMLEFRHVRATDLQKTVQDRLMKRASEIARPVSPSSKKQRLHRSSPPPGDSSHTSFGPRADDTFSMSHSYGSNQQEPWDRVPRHGANVRGQGRFQQPSVIDIVEDSIELVHVDPGDGTTNQPPSQKGVAVSVASQMDNGPPNISIVSVTGNTGPPHGPPPGQHHTQRQHPAPSFHSTPNVSSTSHQSRQTSVSSSPSQPKSSDRSVISLTDPQISQITRELAHQLQQEQASHSASSIRPPQLQLAPGLTSPHENTTTTQQRPPPQFPFSDRLQQSASKPFAAGSVRQVSGLQSGSSSTGSPSTVRPDRSPSLSGKSDSMDRPPSVEANKEGSKQKGEDSSTASSADLMSDITIIKVESGDEAPAKEHKDSGQIMDSGGQMSGDTTGGLDMHVDAPDDGETSGMQIRRIGDDGTVQEGDSDIEELETTGEWGHDDNEDSSMSNDPNNPLGGFREFTSDEDFNESVRQQRLQRIINKHTTRRKLSRQQQIGRIYKKRGRKATVASLKFYLLPDGSKLPHLTKKDPAIEKHQSQGYGYPAIHYSDFKGKTHQVSLNANVDDFKQIIRTLYHRLIGKDFKIYTVSNRRQLIPAPFDPNYFKEISYQGTVIIKIKDTSKPSSTVSVERSPTVVAPPTTTQHIAPRTTPQHIAPRPTTQHSIVPVALVLPPMDVPHTQPPESVMSSQQVLGTTTAASPTSLEQDTDWIITPNTVDLDLVKLEHDENNT